jgi:hypothetical protein
MFALKYISTQKSVPYVSIILCSVKSIEMDVI